MNKFTPGPWFFDEESGTIDVVEEYKSTNGNVNRGWGEIAAVTYRFSVPREQTQENGRLLADAPDLLKTCKELLDVAGWLNSLYGDVLATCPEYPNLCGDWNATQYLMSEANAIAERARALIANHEAEQKPEE